MPRRPAPANDLEREFLAEVKAHGAEIEAAYQKAKDLSDKYGIPFGQYVPESFGERWNTREERWNEETQTDEVLDFLSEDFVRDVAPVDREYWMSSSFHCDVWNYL